MTREISESLYQLQEARGRREERVDIQADEVVSGTQDAEKGRQVKNAALAGFEGQDQVELYQSLSKSKPDPSDL